MRLIALLSLIGLTACSDSLFGPKSPSSATDRAYCKQQEHWTITMKFTTGYDSIVVNGGKDTVLIAHPVTTIDSTKVTKECT